MPRRSPNEEEKQRGYLLSWGWEPLSDGFWLDRCCRLSPSTPMPLADAYELQREHTDENNVVSPRKSKKPSATERTPDMFGSEASPAPLRARSATNPTARTWSEPNPIVADPGLTFGDSLRVLCRTDGRWIVYDERRPAGDRTVDVGDKDEMVALAKVLA